MLQIDSPINYIYVFLPMLNPLWQNLTITKVTKQCGFINLSISEYGVKTGFYYKRIKEWESITKNC